VNRALLKR